MTKTVIPGLKAAHQIITPQCREGRGVGGAFDEAVERISGTYVRYARAEGNEDVTWHLVLVRDGEGFSSRVHPGIPATPPKNPAPIVGSGDETGNA